MFPKKCSSKRGRSAIFGFLFVSVVGTLSHFLYEWSGENILVSLFAPIHESTWEHMKLLFFPMLLYGFLEAVFIVQDESTIAAHLAGTLAGTIFIPILFYTYHGILGFSIPAVDIFIFYLSVFFAFFLRHQGIRTGKYQNYVSVLILATAVFFLCFLLFRFVPPRLALFQNPVTASAASGPDNEKQILKQAYNMLRDKSK